MGERNGRRRRSPEGPNEASAIGDCGATANDCSWRILIGHRLLVITPRRRNILRQYEPHAFPGLSDIMVLGAVIVRAEIPEWR